MENRATVSDKPRGSANKVLLRSVCVGTDARRWKMQFVVACFFMWRDIQCVKVAFTYFQVNAFVSGQHSFCKVRLCERISSHTA